MLCSVPCSTAAFGTSMTKNGDHYFDNPPYESRLWLGNGESNGKENVKMKRNMEIGAYRELL